MNLFTILAWGMLVPISLSSPTAINKMTLAPGIAQSLTCSELATVNTRLDSLIRYAFPPEVPGEKAYAVQGFTHSYKFLINSMHHSDCAAEAQKAMAETESVPMHLPMSMSMSAGEGYDVESYLMGHRNGMKAKRQEDGTNTILCLVIDALLEGVGSGAATAMTTAAAAAVPTLVARQDTGIVQQLLTLLGEILGIVLGCDESGSG
ncbi:uncharacterized protein APUU_60842S [Aspergillus puulaauensis]|uniref:Uncharacterized protein n=1 Tax=Aspergillus puulaauensis TaxID=1220207 RepID=A0A7R7XVZ6_9EURO|nr:uncharacterized protein APUU_60842S [Aspergillus puulaauensis]BCS27794.1 hypothetical protein APUU_60842S [Aspergillus puulaauensis]